MRGSIGVVPLDGFSGFLHCLSGKYSVLTLDLAQILKKGARAKTIKDVLSHMTPAEAKKFMNDTATYAVLSVGDTLWVPFGHIVWSINTSPSAAVLLWQPVLSESLYLKLPADVVTDLKDTMDAFLNITMQQPPWNQHYDSIRRWMAM